VHRHIRTSTLELSEPLPLVDPILSKFAQLLFSLCRNRATFVCTDSVLTNQSLSTNHQLLFNPDERKRRERERDPAHIHTPTATARIIVRPVNGLTAEDETFLEPSANNAMICTFLNSRGTREYAGRSPLESGAKVKSLFTVCSLTTIGDEVTSGHRAGMHSEE
jgi:hypothetical protein